MARWLFFAVRFVVILIVLPLASCSRHPRSSAKKEAAEKPAPAAQTAGGTPPWVGTVLRGDDPQAIQQYLATVREVKPIRFNVRWNPATVAIDKPAAMRSLLSVSRDGATFLFASREPAVRRLKPGSILWVWDIALRKVDRVENVGALTRVHTVPVALNEALPDADIEFRTPVAFDHFFLASRSNLPGSQNATAGSSSTKSATNPSGGSDRSSIDTTGATASRGGLRPVAYRWGNDTNEAGEKSKNDASNEHGEENEENSADAEHDADDVEDSSFSNKFSTTIETYEYTYDITLGYAPSKDGLKLKLEARKVEEEEAKMKREIRKALKEFKEKRKELEEQIYQLKEQAFQEQEHIKQLDEDYEKNLKQLQLDYEHRKDPNYSGPRPPPPPTDEYGRPLTEQAAEAKLTAEYQKQRSIELAKLQQVRQILTEAELKKSQLREQIKQYASSALRYGAKELYEIVSENLDIRFRAIADIKSSDLEVLYQFKNGEIQKARLDLQNLSSEVDTDFTARLGQPGNRGSKVPVLNLPFAYEIPVPVEGIPFVLQVGGDFLLNVFLAGNHATLNLSAKFPLSGRARYGISYAPGSPPTQDETVSKESEPTIEHAIGMSPGVSAAVLAVQIPRIGFGLNVWAMSVTAYFDTVHVFTMTKSADVALGLAAPPCLRTTYQVTGHIGLDTSVTLKDFKLKGFKLGQATASPKIEVFKREKKRVEPPIKACEIGGP